MRTASGLQGEYEEAVKTLTRRTIISSIKRVTTKFPEVSRCSRAKQRQRNEQKKCAAGAKLLFW